MSADALLQRNLYTLSLLRAIWLRLMYLLWMALLDVVEAAWRKHLSRCWLPEAFVVKQ